MDRSCDDEFRWRTEGHGKYHADHYSAGGAEDRPGEYVESHRSELFYAHYCVYVKDTILGALAPHSFAEMVRKAFRKNYRTGEIEFDFSREVECFTDKAFVDVVNTKSRSERGVVGSGTSFSFLRPPGTPHTPWHPCQGVWGSREPRATGRCPRRKERGVAVSERGVAVRGRLPRRHRLGDGEVIAEGGEEGEQGLRQRYVRKNSSFTQGAPEGDTATVWEVVNLQGSQISSTMSAHAFRWSRSQWV